MNKVGFFDKVNYQNPLSALVEDYLFIDRISKRLGSKKLSEVSHDKNTFDLKEDTYKAPSWKRTTVNVLKFLSWGTIFLPLVAVVIREGLRHRHTFKIQQTDTRLSQKILGETNTPLSIPELYQKLQKTLNLPPAKGLSEDQMRAEFAKVTKIQIFEYVFKGNWKALDLSLFPNLKVLELFDSTLKGTLPNLEVCTQLEELFISGFDCEEIPAEINFLTALKKLDLERNPIKKFDELDVLKFQNLTSLEMFVIHGTRAAHSPRELAISNNEILVSLADQNPHLKKIRITHCGLDKNLRNHYDTCVETASRCNLEI